MVRALDYGAEDPWLELSWVKVKTGKCFLSTQQKWIAGLTTAEREKAAKELATLLHHVVAL